MATSMVVALFVIFLLLFILGFVIGANTYHENFGFIMAIVGFIGGVICLGGIGVRLFG